VGAARGGGEIAGEDGSVADLGEWGVIAALKARMPAGALTSVGIGDDAAVVAAPSGSVVAAVDLLIEGRHFRRDWSSAYDVGVKAAARSLADIAAMGAVNTALLVALATPGTLPARWATDLAEGLAFEATRAGAGIVGGDTARADTVTLSVTALGDLGGRRPVLRGGARPGDVLAVAGPLGHSAAGLALLSAGIAPAAARSPGTAPPDTGSPGTGSPDTGPPGTGALAGLVTAHRRPAPPYDAGPEAARLGATAMIDVSDGLLADLGHVAAASGVQVNVNRERLVLGAALRAAAESLLASAPSPGTSAVHSTPPIPLADRPAPPARTVGDGASAAMALEWVLTGGEDHSLVAAFPPGTVLPDRWHVIGEVRAGAGVTVDGEPHDGPGGWQHFR
jgi:thiamine-monophosphate kinase